MSVQLRLVLFDKRANRFVEGQLRELASDWPLFQPVVQNLRCGEVHCYVEADLDLPKEYLYKFRSGGKWHVGAEGREYDIKLIVCELLTLAQSMSEPLIIIPEMFGRPSDPKTGAFCRHNYWVVEDKIYWYSLVSQTHKKRVARLLCEVGYYDGIAGLLVDAGLSWRKLFSTREIDKTDIERLGNSARALVMKIYDAETYAIARLLNKRTGKMGKWGQPFMSHGNERNEA